MRTISYRREMRKKKIEKRQNLIKAICYDSFGHPELAFQYGSKIYNAIHNSKSGLLAKHDYGAITYGCPVKTNTKKAKASHRHMGAYGVAKNYKHHDKLQITYMNHELEEYYNNTEDNNDYTT